MKNLTRRTKTLVGFAGAVIVVLVVGFVVLVPGTAGLFGGDVIHISPQNPTINEEQVIDMSINSVGKCDWTLPSLSVASFWFTSDDSGVMVPGTKSVKVFGEGPGQVTVKAKCFMFTRYTTVTVVRPPLVISPANATIGVGQSVAVSTWSPGCAWSTSNTSIATMSCSSGSCFVTGKAPGTVTITADCGGGVGSATTTLTVQ